MTTGYIKYLQSIFILTTLMTSCYSQRYYRRVVNNVGEFDHVISRISNQHIFEKNDSLLLKNGETIQYNSNICLYYKDMNDYLLKRFMKKYELKRICFSRLNNEYFDSVISFHKDFIPFMDKAVVISYDFGKSGLREKTKNGSKLKNENVRIMNELYLYRVRSKPAFGE